MKKVLIWDISFKLANEGGPAGYLYNIHEYLKEHPNPQITFLSDLYNKEEGKEIVHSESRNTLKRWIRNNSFTLRLLDLLNLLWRSYKTNQVSLPPKLELNNYDYIHFHKTNLVTCNENLLKGFCGKIILTTHCPCLMTDEILASKPKWYRLFRPWLVYQELNAMKKADYLMFPCKGAREPYEKEHRVKRYFQGNEQKIFYVTTALLDIPIEESKIQHLTELGIPEDSFVISYFGRHNYIKGYDILKEVGKELLDKNPNLYFLCAGRGDIKPLNHPRWIELGFISNTHELLYQTDLYILPNRETYFDMVALEVLRSGTFLLLSSTGGNNYFKQIGDNKAAIEFFDVKDSVALINKVKNIIKLKMESPSVFREKLCRNRTLWGKTFTMNVYVTNYLNSVNNL